jgi:lipoprotein-anchoring transpeptidase ErfK/SrfK
VSGDRVTAEEANGAVFADPLPTAQRNLMVKLQVLLDRAGLSPGVIDGYPGENVAKSIAAFEAVYGFPVDGTLDQDVWAVLAADAQPVLVPYSVTAEDLAEPFLGAVPTDYSEMAGLDRVGYASASEMLAERFHMDIDLLAELNAGLEALTIGSTLTVASIGNDLNRVLARLEADKSVGQVRGYDAEGRLVVAYPATIGSTDTPSPSGTHLVTAVVLEAEYSYRPDVNFQQANNSAPLTIPPGPNNPVGGIWIDLSEPTYGIHGTPEPSLIDKTYSHGCVRLTNWDARELAGMVREGVPVDFL